MPETAKVKPLQAPSVPVPAEIKEEKVSPPKVLEKKPGPSLQEEWSNFWTNWYSDNSINLLLYLGAFLIVASASIYVGFQWETIGGVSKAALLSLLTFTFFGFGAWFYNVPKIKQAGATFIAIAALLIPFGGLAWHNFVLGPAGYSIGSVWLATSIIAVLAYSVLAYTIRHPFYTYIAGFGGLSMILSMVNTAQLNREFYILGGIFSSFVLLLSTRLFHDSDTSELKNYVTPLSLSANIIMPIALVFGIVLAATGDKLFSLEVVVSAFLATLYYVLAYTFDRQVGYLYISLFLLPVSTILFGKWLDFPLLQILIPIQIISFVYLAVSSYLKQKFPKEYEATSLSAHIIMPFSSFSSLLLVFPLENFFAGELVISSILITAFYALAYYFSRESTHLLISQLLLAVSAFIVGSWLSLSALPIIIILEILAWIYIGSSYLIRSFVKESAVSALAANIIVPFSLLWLLFEATEPNSFFTGPVVLAAATGSFYYALAYLLKRKSIYLVLFGVLLPITTFLFGRWLGLDDLQSYYLIECLLFGFIAISFLLKKWSSQDSGALTVVSLMYAAFTFVLVFGEGYSAFHETLFAALPAVLGLIAVYAQKDSKYLYYNIIFLIIAVFLYFNSLLGLEDQSQYAGGAYIALTIVFYLLALSTRKFKGAFAAFTFGAVLTALLGHFLTLEHDTYFFFGNITVAAIFADYGIRYRNFQYIYISNLFIYLALWTILRRFEVQTILYPLFFTGLSYAFYLATQGLSDSLKHFYRLTALVGSGATTVVFGLLSQTEPGGYYSTSQGKYVYDSSFAGLEKTALVSSYAAAFIYSVDATLVKKASLGYFASAVGMFTYLWQMKFLGVTETQVYTLALGVYFMVLAYFQRIAGNFANRDLLNYVGLAFLFVPTFFQSFSDGGAKYALLMGVEGLIVFALGTSLSYRTYIYTGIAAIVVAVISQTYEFVFSLPRWMITAAAGILLLSTAIYLLLSRKEEHRSE
jgi:hypothetical protein